MARFLDDALGVGGELVSLMESGATVDPAAGLAVVPQWTDAVETVTDLWQGEWSDAVCWLTLLTQPARPVPQRLRGCPNVDPPSTVRAGGWWAPPMSSQFGK